MRMIKHWHRLPRMVVESSSFDILKTQLGMVLSYLLQPALLWTAGLDESVSRSTLQPQSFNAVSLGMGYIIPNQNSYFF